MLSRFRQLFQHSAKNVFQHQAPKVSDLRILSYLKPITRINYSEIVKL